MARLPASLPEIEWTPRMNAEKVAVVTGAGSGIGKAVALALAGNGYRVVLAGRRAALLAEVAAQAQASFGAGARMLCVPTDVCDPAAVESLFGQAVARFGRVDLLFNNAGRGNPPGSFLDWTPQQWRDVVDVNLNGMFYPAAGLSDHARSEPAGRAHHQQWLDFCTRAPAQLGRLHRDKTCRDGSDENCGT